MYALVHDAPEVYAGDTPTLRITAQGRAAKAVREHAALDRLHTEFGDRLPWFPHSARGLRGTARTRGPVRPRRRQDPAQGCLNRR
jgi:HD domain-containing protein